jgi:transglutaminase-like putative cysteine protease
LDTEQGELMVLSSARYRIKHQTRYQYSDPVAICQNQLRMMPTSREQSLSQIDCHRVETLITPEPDVISQHTDYFGNTVYSFSIESLHRKLEISVQSEVTVTSQQWPDPDQSVSWQQIVEQLSNYSDQNWSTVEEFCFDSPRIRRGEKYRDYALKSFATERNVIDAAMELTRRVNEDFKYDTKATDVNTPTDKAFDMKAGVCQDFAHVQVACLRSIGLPARYVSGYLRTTPSQGEDPLVGSDESHAWVSLYMGQQFGWIDFDPTNACRCDANHIPVCLGRDYSEVSPMRGVVLGGGETSLQVSVDVQVLGDE